MKATIFAAVALACGIAVGLWTNRREFANEVLPIDITPASAVSGGVRVGPKITIVNGERHDFGTMDRNAHGKHAWIVRNDGDAPLTLSTGQPSCGVCIKVFNVAKETLKPGEKTEVNIEWDVKTGDQQFEQSGPLTTNDKNRQTVTLYIRGNVLDTVRTDRGDIHFHDLSANESATGSVNIFAFREADLKVEKYEFVNPQVRDHVTVTFTPLSSDELAREPNAKGGLKMTLEVKPGLPYGDFEDSVNIHTNQYDEPLTVRVIGNIASDVVLVGPNVTRDKLLVGLGAIPQSVGKKHTVFILVKGPHRDETQVKIDSVEPATEFSATLGEPIRDSAKIVRYPLTIEVPAGATPVTRMDALSARINISTTHPDVKELPIKVRYVVKNG
jgi:hypothetical protein